MKRMIPVVLSILAIWLCVYAQSPQQQLMAAAGSSASCPCPFVTGQTLGTLRNNFTGCMGLAFTTDTSPPTVTALGRWKVSGNSGTHIVALVKNATTVVASASIDMTTGSAGTYVYVDITPVVLDASSTYQLVSPETNTGDQWYDDDTVITSNSGRVTLTKSAFFSGAPPCTGTVHNQITGRSYVPVNIKFQ